MPQLKLYYIYFPEQQMQYDVGTVKINNDNLTVQNAGICRILNAESYDIADYSDEISILVDDASFYKSGLPIWKLEFSEDVNFLVVFGQMMHLTPIFSSHPQK